MLYIVPTPVGNLEDITIRAKRILSEVDYVFCEDTRVTGQLMKHLEIKKPLRSFHAHNEHKTVDQLIDLLQAGSNIALVSDAGTPAISDPGFLLVRQCQELNIELTCLPGATAFVPALVASGLPCDKFLFEGFLPHKKGRQKRLGQLLEIKTTIVFYESPHRLLKLLKEINEYFGSDTKVSVSREISKIHEEYNTNSVSALLEDYSNRPSIKGEIVVVVDNR